MSHLLHFKQFGVCQFCIIGSKCGKNKNKNRGLRQVAHEAVSSHKGAHHSSVIGRMLREICCRVVAASWLRCCVAKTPVAFGAQCVSIPAHLQPFLQVGP